MRNSAGVCTERTVTILQLFLFEIVHVNIVGDVSIIKEYTLLAVSFRMHICCSKISILRWHFKCINSRNFLNDNNYLYSPKYMVDNKN